MKQFLGSNLAIPLANFAFNKNSRQIFPHSHWAELRACIVVVSDQRKSTPSSEGMKRSVATSTLLRHRADAVVPARLEALRSAISNRNFDEFAEITMKESNSLHATCLDTFPPLSYLNESSHGIIDLGTNCATYEPDERILSLH